MEGSLFFQRAEGVLHVLQKLGVVGLDLGLAVLHWVLYAPQKDNTGAQTLSWTSRIKIWTRAP